MVDTGSEEGQRERQQLLAAVAAQAVRQAALLRLSAELAALVDEAELCRCVVDGLHDTLGYDFVALFLLDEDTGDRVYAASAGPIEPPTRILPGKGLSERPLLDGQLQYTPDVTQDPRYIPWMEGSEVDVPVRSGEEVLGVLIVESRQKNAFNQDDFEVLVAAAQQAGLAIARFRLYAAERQRADELEALRTTMADITSELELPALLQAIVERAAGLLDATGGELGLYDDAIQEIRIVVSHNLDKDYVGTRHELGQGAMGRVAETGQPLIIEDYHAWDRRAPQYADIAIRAVLAVPLQVGNQLVGVITLATTDPNRQFSPADLHLLSLFAQQATIAIENARLYDQAQREIAERVSAEEERERLLAAEREQRQLAETLREASLALGSTLEADQVLEQLLEQIGRVIQYDSANVMQIEDGMVRITHRRGYECDGTVEASTVLQLPVDEIPNLQRMLATRCPHIVADTMADPEWVHLEPSDWIRSWAGAPIIVQAHVSGFFALHSRKRGFYRPEHADLLAAFAAHAAIAIENARLFDRGQREIAERVRAEEELRQYQEHLEELVEARAAELRESEERYRSLFDGVPIGLYRSTPAGEMVDANVALVQMLAYPSRADLLAADTASSYVDPEDRAQWQALMEQAGIVRDFECQIHRYDGSVIWINDTARAVKDEQGQVLYYEGSVEDITKRKQTEEKLREYREHLEELVEARTAELRQSEERYRTLFDGVPVGLYRATWSGELLDVNLAATQMFGYPSQEYALTVMTPSVYVDPEERVRWQKLMQREGVVHGFEAQVYRHDGSVIWIHDTARAVKDEQGQVLYYEGSLEDITERKRIEQELRRQKEYFEALFVNSPVAVVTGDFEAHVVSWNPMAEKLFGYSREEAIGKPIDELVARDDAIRAEALGYTKKVIDLGRVQATTKRTRKDGSLVDVELLTLPLILAGETVGFIAIYHDITELQQARRDAEAASQAKSTFLANMSHELRTPLNAILGFTQLMDGDPNLTHVQRENLKIINNSGEHLLALINDVLEMSKIEAGRVTLQDDSFDLHHMLAGLEEMFRLRAEEKELTLSFRRTGTVPRYVRADEGKLRQVLSNLLGNAVKFTQEGGVALRISASSPDIPCPPGREMLCFQVEDTGPGIAPEQCEAIFDPFVQVTEEQQPQEGTGLGLSISRQYVQLMGGDLAVSSELGKGTLFSFHLPVGQADVAEVAVARPRRRVIGLAAGQRAADGGAYRLLVVEDRETNRRLLVRLLTKLGQPPLGFEIREAENGQEAIEIWESWKPHLIWMDMRMPIMDGHEATKRIKSLPDGAETVIIALTATAFEEDRERILLEGCDDFVRKPFRKDQIYDVLAQQLGVRFVYEEIDREDQDREMGKPEVAAVQEVHALAAMPAEWRADLQQATIKADLNRMLSLIEQIRGQAPSVANTLAGLAQDFEYKMILALIEEAGG